MNQNQYFEKVGQIDFLYFCFKKMAIEYNKPVDPITAMIDRSTGYMEEKTKDTITDSIDIIKKIIKLKKEIKFDYDSDEKLLGELIELKNKK